MISDCCRREKPPSCGSLRVGRPASSHASASTIACFIGVRAPSPLAAGDDDRAAGRAIGARVGGRTVRPVGEPDGRISNLMASPLTLPSNDVANDCIVIRTVAIRASKDSVPCFLASSKPLRKPRCSAAAIPAASTSGAPAGFFASSALSRVISAQGLRVVCVDLRFY